MTDQLSPFVICLGRDETDEAYDILAQIAS